ncbi:hypothetical protein DFJ74DRAFT_656284 [Hyaloraphidium curvatum]|nr:hypothetical protein DFJ74DRAFT_656284 [Hyaloraphidium curvatum]
MERVGSDVQHRDGGPTIGLTTSSEPAPDFSVARDRTESEITLVNKVAETGTLGALGTRSGGVALLDEPAKELENELHLIPGDQVVGKDESGALHHTYANPSGIEDQNHTNASPSGFEDLEFGGGREKKRSEEILVRSIRANKPLVSIPGVPEARDETGRPLPVPAFPSSIRPCVDGQHTKASRDLSLRAGSASISKIGANEYIFFAAVFGLSAAGWIVGLFGGSFIWLAAAAAIGAIYIRNVRLEDQRKLDWERHRAEGSFSLGRNLETAEWLNFFVAQIWNIMNSDLFASLTDMIEDQANLLAKDMLKGFVYNIACRDFELGPHPPRITSIQVFPQASGEDSILMDISMSMEAPPQLTNPNDQSRLGMHLVLSMDLGEKNALGGVTVPTLVEISQIEVKMRLQITLSSVPPFAKEARISLLAEPVIGLSIKPLKLVNLMNLPLLPSFVLASITSAINELALAPKVLRIDLETLLTGQEVSSDTRSLGIVKVIIHEAIGFRKADAFTESDPYVMISVESFSRPVARTRVVSDNPRPVWHDSHYILVSDDHVRADSKVTLSVWDWDSEKPDDLLGTAEFSVRDLIDVDGPFFQGWKALKGLGSGNEDQGWIRCEIGFYPKTKREEIPVTETGEFADELRKREKKSETRHSAGILGILVHQGSELAVRKKDAIHDYVSAYAKIFINDVPTFRTRTKSHNPAPYWNISIERPVMDLEKAVIRIVVKDERPREWDPVIGVVVVKLGEILDLARGKRTDTRWWNVDGGIGFGKLRISFVFRTVQLVETPNLSGFDVGTIVLGRFRARNLDKLCQPSHKPSPYVDVRLSLAADTEWTRKTTPVLRHDANPTWPEEAVLPFRTLHRTQAVLQISVHDHSRGKLLPGSGARVLGSASFYAQDLIDGRAEWFRIPLVAEAGKSRTDPLYRHLPVRVPHLQRIGGVDRKERAEEPMRDLEEEERERGEKEAQLTIARSDGPLMPLVVLAACSGPEQSEMRSEEVRKAEKLSGGWFGDVSPTSFPDEDDDGTPCIIFKANFRPGLSWVETIRNGEEYEIGVVQEQLPEFLEQEQAQAQKKKGKRSFFGGGGSQIRTGETAQRARDDKMLPGNHLTRSLAWSLGLGGEAASRLSKSLWVARKERHLPDLPIENE